MRQPGQSRPQAAPGQGTSRSARRRRRNADGARVVQNSSGGMAIARMSNAAAANAQRGLDAGGMFLSTLSQNYARALANPYTGPLVGVPTIPTLYSRVDRYFAKGTFNTSTAAGGQGFGWIVCDPYAAASSNGLAVIATTATYDTLAIDEDRNATTAGTVQTFNSNSPYAAGSFAAGSISARIVSAALRVRYDGVALNLGGKLFPLEHPAHANLQTNTIPTIRSYVESGSFNIESRWTNINYRAVDTDDYNFYPNAAVATQPNTTTAGAAALATNYHLGMVVQAPSGTTSTPLDFEFYVVVEMCGNLVPGKVLAPSDPVGADSVATVHLLSDDMRSGHQKDASDVGMRAAQASDHYAKHVTSNPLHKTDAGKAIDHAKNWVDGALDVVKGVSPILPFLGSVLGI